MGSQTDKKARSRIAYKKASSIGSKKDKNPSPPGSSGSLPELTSGIPPIIGNLTERVYLSKNKIQFNVPIGNDCRP